MRVICRTKRPPGSERPQPLYSSVTMQGNHVILLAGGMTLLEFFTRLFSDEAWDLDAVEPPWGERPSIFAHILAHIPEGEVGLTEGGDELPDEAEVYGEGGLRWIPGGRDGAYGHHESGGDDQEAAKEVFELLKAVLRKPTQKSVQSLYEALETRYALDFVDPLLKLIVSDRGVDTARLHKVAVWLATQAADREPVKVAISILGGLEGTDDRDTILTLARHEEFTFYAAVAISNLEEHPDRTLWQIARQVDGWGRIQTVERLSETKDPDIKRWLLRDGYKNKVMGEYLAYTCATAGDLCAALAGEEIDEALLVAAGDLLKDLIWSQLGGPAEIEGLDDYEDGAAVTQLYLRHLKERPRSLEHLSVLKLLKRYLEDDEEDWTERAEKGWTAEARASMLTTINSLVRDPSWSDQIEAGLKSEEPAE